MTQLQALAERARGELDELLAGIDNEHRSGCGAARILQDLIALADDEPRRYVARTDAGSVVLIPETDGSLLVPAPDGSRRTRVEVLRGR